MVALDQMYCCASVVAIKQELSIVESRFADSKQQTPDTKTQKHSPLPNTTSIYRRI
jgi:hypothetical protein